MASEHLKRIRQQQQQQEQQQEQQDLRTGATVLGMFAGLAAGFFVAWLQVRARWANDISPLLVFGGGLLGGLVGYWRFGAGLHLFEAVLHYLIGFFSSASQRIVRPSPKAPPWLRVVLLLGVVSGLLAMVFLNHHRWRF